MEKKYNLACNEVLNTWQSSMGQRSGFRSVLDNTGIQRTEVERLNASTIRTNLKQCAHEIELPTTLLFRGTGDKNGPCEEFTATSLSFEVAYDYKPPFPVILVPSKKVHGLVVGGTRSSKDSEILLIDPILEQCSEKVVRLVKEELNSKCMLEAKDVASPHYEDLLIYTYKGHKPLESAL